MQIDQRTENIEEFRKLVFEIAQQLPARAVLLMNGPMGVGKTEFVKRLGEFWKLAEVASPTFAIHHRYELKDKVLDHFDLYRIQSREELEGTGFWDLLNSARGIVAIEWPDKIKFNELPQDFAVYHCEIDRVGDDEKRQVRVRLVV
jgi:tRNA threonylcarbamoyladenosine biosynthesis protein TsaE